MSKQSLNRAGAKYRKSERYKITYINRYKTPHFRSKILLSGIIRRSSLRGLVCDLTEEWLTEKLQKGICEVTGIPFIMETKKERGGPQFYSPSVDRIDNSRGYTKDNCRVVLHGYNSGKGMATDKDMIYMAEMLLGLKDE